MCEPVSIVASKYSLCLSVIGISKFNSVRGSMLDILNSPVVLVSRHIHFLLELIA